MDARDIVGRTAFFTKVLDQAHVDLLAAGARPARFAKGDPLMREGELGQSMFLIAEGKVTVSIRERGGEQQVATLGPGDIVGEMSLLTGARRSATVRAAGKVSALEIPKAALEPILADSPELVHRFAEIVEQRHGEIDRRHQDAARWNAVGMGRAEVAARMTAFYSG